MSDHYADWHRRRARGDVTSAQELRGRKVLGELMDELRLSGLPTGVRRVVDSDGTSYVASFDGTTPTIMVVATPSPPGEQPELAQMWTPRGFVVFPAWADKKYGIGLPVVQDPPDGSEPYSNRNLAPGLAIDRWTPAGMCGEVLISPDDEAGYPIASSTPVPLMWDHNYGPRPIALKSEVVNDTLPPGGGAWKSYRCEFVGFQAWDGKNNVGWAQGLFETTNAARVAANVAAAWLPFRGYADLAYSAALVLSQYNLPQAMNPVYPASYGSGAVRLCKDGYPTDMIGLAVYAPADFNRTFTGGKMIEAGAVGMDAGAAFTAWQAASAGSLTIDTPSSQLYSAEVGAFGVADFTLRDRWINTGNIYWKGKDAALPPLTWHGFMSVNLHWETFPVRYNIGADSSTNPFDVIQYPFTDASGDCWLRYARGPYKGGNTIQSALVEPALSPHIYARGRAIALAPRGGLVWGACVLPNGPDTDRLIALIHHPEDQPSDAIHLGMTRYIRVWYCDIPRRPNGLTLAPVMPVAGEDATDPLAWKGGEQFDLGYFNAPGGSLDPSFTATDQANSSLKYSSAWKFSADGTKAACLRDYGSFVDYYLPLAEDAIGRLPRVMEFNFEIPGVTDKESSQAALSTTLLRHDYLPALTAPQTIIPASTPFPSETFSFNSDLYHSLYPLAVDFDADNNMVFMYGAQWVSHDHYEWDNGQADPTLNSWYSESIRITGVGIGGSFATSSNDLSDFVRIGCNFQTPLGGWRDDRTLVMDVNTATFANRVSEPRFAIDVTNLAQPLDLTKLDRPCPFFTNAPVLGVLLARGGVVTAVDWYPNPDGSLWAAGEWCLRGTTTSMNTEFLPLSASNNVQTFHVERFGQLVYGYQVAPMPQAVYAHAAVEDTSLCGCEPELTGEVLSTVDFQSQNPRGGRVISTVPLPEHDWLVYAKVV